MGIFGLFQKKNNNELIDDTARYALEHLRLPELIFDKNGANILKTILIEKGEFFIFLYNTMHKEESDYVCRYSTDDFKVQPIRLVEQNNEKLVVRIQMPKPERTTLCNSIYVVIDENFNGQRYITTELSHGGGLVICEWKYLRHCTYGYYSEELLRKIIFG